MSHKVAKFRVPAQITLGKGAAGTVGAEAKRLGGTHAFVVSDPALHQLGITDKIVASLEAEGVKATVYTEVEFEPSVQSVAPCAANARQSRCNLVVGVGGGTSLDTAKAAAVLLTNEGTVEDYLGIGLVRRRGVPSILLPTPRARAPRSRRTPCSISPARARSAPSSARTSSPMWPSWIRCSP